MTIRRRLLELAVMVAIIASTGMILLPRMKGGRTRFSPDTLKWASQTQYSVSLDRGILYRSEWKEYSTDVVDYLISKGYWKPRVVSKPLWLITYKWSGSVPSGHSQFNRELRSTTWIDWSDAHPELANDLWPRVLTELRRGDDQANDRAGYLLNVAKHSTSLDEFHQAIATDPDTYGPLKP